MDAHRAGLSPDRIAEASRWTPMLVHKVLGEAGLLPPRRGRPYPYDARVEAQIASAYEAGATMAELVARHGGSNRTVSYVLEHRGIPTRTKGRRSKPRPGQQQ